MAFMVPSMDKLEVWKVDSYVQPKMRRTCEDQQYRYQYLANKQQFWQAVSFVEYQSVLHEVV